LLILLDDNEALVAIGAADARDVTAREATAELAGELVAGACGATAGLAEELAACALGTALELKADACRTAIEADGALARDAAV